MDSKKFQLLRDKYADVKPTAKKTYSPEEVDELRQMALKAKDMGAEEKKLALGIVQKKMGKQLDPLESLVEAGDSLPDEPYIKPVTNWGPDIGKKMQTGVSGEDFVDKIAAKLGKGKKLLGSLPLIGGLAAASSGDVFAAAPVVGDALETEELGPEKGSLEHKLESGEAMSTDEKKLLFKDLRTRY